jgi:hypothetical protein
MVAAILAMESNESQHGFKNGREENFLKFYEAIFIDPSKLTPY